MFDLTRESQRTLERLLPRVASLIPDADERAAFVARLDDVRLRQRPSIRAKLRRGGFASGESQHHHQAEGKQTCHSTTIPDYAGSSFTASSGPVQTPSAGIGGM